MVENPFMFFLSVLSVFSVVSVVSSLEEAPLGCGEIPSVSLPLFLQIRSICNIPTKKFNFLSCRTRRQGEINPRLSAAKLPISLLDDAVVALCLIVRFYQRHKNVLQGRHDLTHR